MLFRSRIFWNERDPSQQRLVSGNEQMSKAGPVGTKVRPVGRKAKPEPRLKGARKEKQRKPGEYLALWIWAWKLANTRAVTLVSVQERKSTQRRKSNVEDSCVISRPTTEKGRKAAPLSWLLYPQTQS